MRALPAEECSIRKDHVKMKASLEKFDIAEAGNDINHLLKATAEMADEAVVSARKRLISAASKAGLACEHSAKDARRFVHGHAGETAVVALLAGVAVGYLLSRNFD